MNTKTKIGKVQTIVVVASLLASLFVGFASPAQAATSVFVNEIHYDNASTDVGEAIEIAGPAGTDLSGWSIALYNGSSTQLSVYDTITLSGVIPNQQDGFGTLSFLIAGIQNGSPDGLALVDSSSNVVQFLSYEGSFTAASGPAAGMTSTDIGVDEPGDTPVGYSLQLTGEGSIYEDFVWTGPSANTIDAVNSGQTFVGDSTPNVIINELDSDTPGTDALEFVELYDGGVGNIALDGLVVVFYNGNGDTSYNAFDLDGYSTDANGYFVLGNAGVAPTPAIIFAGGALQNGADAVAIYTGDAADFPSGTALTTDGLLDAIVYDTDDADDAGLLVLLNAGQPQVNENGAGDKDNHSNQRCPNGAGGALNTDAYTQDAPTPGAANNCVIPLPDVVINELDSDTVGTDALEFVELYDGGVGNSALDGLIVVFYNGSNDLSYDSFDLDGYSTDANGYFVLGNAGVAPTPAIIFGGNGLQNGADAVAIYTGDAADFAYGTALSTSNLLDAIVYDTDDSDDAGLLVLLNAGQPQVNESGGGNSTAHSNQRCPNGEGGALNTDTYTQNAPTPGAVNNCPIPTVSIHDIQYTSDASGDSPYINQAGITTEGVVTALFYNGYFIEDPAGGAWSGLFVYDTHTPNRGDLLRVTGTVAEYSGLTELASLTGYEVLSSDNALPAPAVLASGDVSQEQWESVLLRVENVTVTDDSLGYGEWLVSDGSGDARLDDKGSYTYTPHNGDLLNVITGVLDHGFGTFRIQPRDDNDIFMCGDPATPIYEVQGSGSASPLYGTSGVIIEGVVVGDFQTGAALSGFFLQEQDSDADGDTATSDGIFVYDGYSPALDVSVGDVVRVEGRVTEYYGLTELTSVSAIAVCDTGGVATAASVTLPVSSLGQWEQYEGMLINIPQTLYATGNYYQGRYGEVDLSVGGRLDNPTNVVAPGDDAIALQAANDLRRIQLEDGRTSENPVPAPYMGEDGTLRAGDTLPELTGVLHYAFDYYELHPTAELNFTRVNARQAAPADVGGTLKVASFNVLNYFSTIDDSGPICGPTGGMDCRGADTAAEFTRQRDKIIAAIVAMDADVVGLMEIENHATDAALQDLVNGLNTAAGAGTYDYVGTGPIHTDAIKVAFIYQPSTVTPVGSFAILDSSVDSTFIDTRNRPALAQTFQHTTDEIFTVVVNHLKSKGSACEGDPDMGDGQGNCNLTRTAAAEALVNWLAGDPTGSGDADFMIIGDLNSYAMEDPITALKTGGYTDLVQTFGGAGAYSYVFMGQSGYLDHALASSALTARVMGMTEWHINADEPSALNYNDYNQPELYNPDQFCASDHDPVIVGICDAIPPTVNVQVTPDTLWPPNHKYVTVKATVDFFDATGGTTLTFVSVTSNEPDDGLGDGDTPDDIVIVDDFTFKLRAERSGTGDGRIYTITYKVTDACGNSTVATATVTVPHDQGKGGD